MWRTAAIAGATAVFLAVSGAFGTGEAPFALRLGYWLLALGLGGAIGVGVAQLFSRRDWLEGPAWRVIAAMTLAISLPLTLVTWALTALLFGRPLRWEQLLDLALPVVIVTAAVTALNILLGRRPPMTHASTPDATAAPTPARFLDRLPPKLRGAELHAVQAEDHYLRLHTSRGSDLILLRLADAIAELEGVEGAQTHRSWWVAREAVTDARRSEGRAALLLANGVEAPVSRTYARALREAGWF